MSYRLAAVALIAACGGSPPATHEPAAAPLDDPTCPVSVPGTSVTVETPPDGVELVFVTTGDVAQVLARAQAFATALHDRHPGGTRFVDMIETPTATATARAGDHRVTISFVAGTPEDVAAIQSEVKMHASHLASGTCKMAM